MLFCLIVDDFGDFYTVRQLGIGIYYGVSEWNALDRGNIPFVFAGAQVRVAFLLGIGLSGRARAVLYLIAIRSNRNPVSLYRY